MCLSSHWAGKLLVRLTYHASLAETDFFGGQAQFSKFHPKKNCLSNMFKLNHFPRDSQSGSKVGRFTVTNGSVAAPCHSLYPAVIDDISIGTWYFLIVAP